MYFHPSSSSYHAVPLNIPTPSTPPPMCPHICNPPVFPPLSTLPSLPSPCTSPLYPTLSTLLSTLPSPLYPPLSTLPSLPPLSSPAPTVIGSCILRLHISSYSSTSLFLPTEMFQTKLWPQGNEIAIGKMVHTDVERDISKAQNSAEFLNSRGLTTVSVWIGSNMLANGEMDVPFHVQQEHPGQQVCTPSQVVQ